MKLQFLEECPEFRRSSVIAKQYYFVWGSHIRVPRRGASFQIISLWNSNSIQRRAATRFQFQLDLKYLCKEGGLVITFLDLEDLTFICCVPLGDECVQSKYSIIFPQPQV